MSRDPEAKLFAEPLRLFPVTSPLGELHEVNMKITNSSKLMENTSDVEYIFLRIFSLVAYAATTRPKTPVNILIKLFIVMLLVLPGF